MTRFGVGHGNDTIFDFTDGDVIDLSSFALTNFSDLTLSPGTSGVTIDLSAYAGGTILLDGFTISNLDATDFLL